MNLINNIKSFLLDKNYFISVFDNSIHLYGFLNIKKFEENELDFEFEEFCINIKGEKFLIKKMLPNEVLVNGNIKSFNKYNEKSNLD